MIIRFSIFLDKKLLTNVIVDFLEPLTSRLIQSNQVKYVDYSINFEGLWVLFSINSHKIREEIINDISSSWETFSSSFKTNFNYNEAIINTLFLKYPNGYLKFYNYNINEADQELSPRISKFTMGNIQILKYFNDNKDEENKIILFFIFLYCIGGYSFFEINKICSVLIDSFSFNNENKKNIVVRAKNVVNKNYKELKRYFDDCFFELSKFNQDSSLVSSDWQLVSKWKFFYGNLINTDSIKEEDRLINLFDKYKNQLMISSGEAYFILEIIHQTVGESIS
ncbi:hypothetical protein P8625_14360 [Tenacibaculum tangerinum]|uniref:Thiopeptide-type bacteriocin biosynthesis domain-containing protein n=1 Tax=Tenacibaculum tangerinum TaxID=3038772 RepID=A0ABY8L519_9FLAO|nr:hypothetical protein [Tenacibaculum tangerinum]WGH75240.1 hypothetical protein P8625_14360 [Tenacibaculum tangerinum]